MDKGKDKKRRKSGGTRIPLNKPGAGTRFFKLEGFVIGE